MSKLSSFRKKGSEPMVTEAKSLRQQMAEQESGFFAGIAAAMEIMKPKKYKINNFFLWFSFFGEFLVMCFFFR